MFAWYLLHGNEGVNLLVGLQLYWDFDYNPATASWRRWWRRRDGGRDREPRDHRPSSTLDIRSLLRVRIFVDLSMKPPF